MGAIEEHAREWQEWNQETYRRQAPRAADPGAVARQNGRGISRFLMIAGSIAGGFVINTFYNRKAVQALKNKQNKQMDLIWEQALSEKEKQMSAKNAEISELQRKYQEAERYFQELSQLVFDAKVESDKEQLKADYKEFSEPDLNKDGYISRTEFQNYLQQHYKKNPHIPLSDYPTFDDFEQNGDGRVSFEEWRQYLQQIEQQAALQAQLQEYYAQMAQHQRR